jgi:hypothetical protein
MILKIIGYINLLLNPATLGMGLTLHYFRVVWALHENHVGLT